MVIFIKKITMHQTFDITKTSRKLLSQFLENYTLEQLNTIPEGFKNNLIWNIGHIVVVQQIIVYQFSGLPMLVSNEMVEMYKKGSKPEQDVTQVEVEVLQSLPFKTINQTMVDYNSKIFKSFQGYTTSTGFTMKNVEDALSFNYYHEALHTGILMSLRKLV